MSKLNSVLYFCDQVIRVYVFYIDEGKCILDPIEKGFFTNHNVISLRLEMEKEWEILCTELDNGSFLKGKPPDCSCTTLESMTHSIGHLFA